MPQIVRLTTAPFATFRPELEAGSRSNCGDFSRTSLHQIKSGLSAHSSLRQPCSPIALHYGDFHHHGTSGEQTRLHTSRIRRIAGNYNGVRNLLLQAWSAVKDSRQNFAEPEEIGTIRD
jgi:hypothetical protein